MASPSSSQIESAFRSIIAQLYKADNLADLTVKRVRTTAEQQLGLEANWFKEHEEWRDRSKTFITEEAQRQAESPDNDTSSQNAANETNGQAKGVESVNVTNARGKKRTVEANTVTVPSRKRKSETPIPQRSKAARRIVDSDDEDDESDQSSSKTDEDDDFASGGETQKKHDLEESELSEVLDDTPSPTKRAKTNKTKRNARSREKMKPQKRKTASPKPRKVEQEEEQTMDVGPDSESEMSSLIDEEPLKKMKKTKKSEKPVSKDKKSKATKSSKDADLTPDELEVRKLKDWLGKCGVRKMWARELASCESPKQKISHLRQMLKDVGMDGRPSLAKANEIREQRELAEELEETQKFNQRWGKAQGNGRGRSAADAIADLGIEFDDESD